MPKKMHKRLEKAARKKGLTGKRKKAYVYGTMKKRSKKKQSALQFAWKGSHAKAPGEGLGSVPPLG